MELKKREEIIKTLESCNGGGNGCLSCTYFYKAVDTSCAPFLIKDALALIKELTEEIRDLEADYDRVYEQAEADIRGNMADGGTSCHWCMNKTKADVVKRMQTMFEEHLDISACGYSTEEVVGDVLETLDRVAKELLEGKNNV